MTLSARFADAHRTLSARFAGSESHVRGWLRQCPSERGRAACATAQQILADLPQASPIIQFPFSPVLLLSSLLPLAFSPKPHVSVAPPSCLSSGRQIGLCSRERAPAVGICSSHIDGKVSPVHPISQGSYFM